LPAATKIAQIAFSSWLLAAITAIFLNVLLDEEISTEIPAILVIHLITNCNIKEE
jgi:ABC-type phosphate/phosphonate transport system permease subunit